MLSAIDCDVHPAAPTMPALLRFLDEHWRNSVVERGIPSLETNSYPARAPISARPQWRNKNGTPEAGFGQLTGQVFGRWRAERAGNPFRSDWRITMWSWRPKRRSPGGRATWKQARHKKHKL